uniref:Gustatory receptor n=1 Tax=Meloidogyne javanica TaxID=6303 RepID=A0A915LX57_MELJA
MYGRRYVWDRSKPINHLEWAPPMRVIAAITLFAATLDLMADFLLCSRLAEFLHNFQTERARLCAYGYFFFTGVSVLVYIFEIVDVCLTLKNEEEDLYFARLAKSMVLVFEEHDRDENIRRCFKFNLYRCTMIVVNICHLFAIFIVINNLIVSGRGGRPIQQKYN